jgi:hypothetical protein
MNSEANYYNVLQSAIARTQPDSFEARGAIYDRAWQIVLDQSYADQIASEEGIALERAAFLRAIQRIEFNGGPPPQEENGRPAGPRAAKSPSRVPLKAPRRMFWRIAAGMVSACIALLVAGIAYALIAIRSDPTVAERWVDQSDANSWQSQMVRAVVSFNNFIDSRPATTTTTTSTSAVAAQRAVLYEESAATATGTTFSGRAVWRHQSKSKTSTAALLIEVEIPQKNLILEISMRRAPDGGAASHFVEFQFFGPNRSLSDAVEDVVGILMKDDELARGIALKGQVVRVQRGMFLMGLSGTDDDVARNMKLLKDRPWLDIPIIFRGGARSILAIEKGTAGQNALNEALTTWGQG